MKHTRAPEKSNRLSITLSIALSLGFALLVVAGCDGGGGTASSPGANTVELAKDDSTIAQVRTVLDSLVGQRPAVIARKALAYIQALPQFKASGISDDGSVWAQFQDGVLYSIATNDPDLDVQPAHASTKTAAAKNTVSTNLGNSVRSSAAGGEIPGSATAYVFNAMEANRGIPDDKIALQLTAAGYTVVRGTGSLADWKGVTNAGVLFSACHGTRLPDGGVKVFYMQSSDAHVKGDKTYLAELAAHTMAFDEVAVDDDTLVRGKSPKWHWESRYLFKAEYLSNRNMFADNGFMFNAACSGTSGPGLVFAQSLKARNNLGVYGGWSQPVYIPDDIESMLFFFDRALGINQFAPVDAANPPPQDWSTVLSAMVANARASGNGTHLNASDVQLYDTAGHDPIAVFSIQNLSGGDLQTLVPSAIDATPDAANGSLVFTGSFGSSTGRVTVDGIDMPVKAWSPGKITTALPKASGSALIISKTGLISNKVPVTVTSIVSLTPKSGGYLPGDVFGVVASPSGGNGPAYTYHWKLAGSSLATLQDQSGAHTSAEFDSPDGSVYVSTTPSTQGTLTVTCAVSTVTAGAATLVGSATTAFKEYPFSNQILYLSSVYQSNPKAHKYFAYVLLKKDSLNSAAVPTIRWRTYVNGTLKAASSVQGTAKTKVYDIATLGDPNVGAPYILISVKDTQLLDPADQGFTLNNVPYPYDLGNSIALVVAYQSWDTTQFDGVKSIAFVDTTAAKTQVVAGLIYP